MIEEYKGRRLKAAPVKTAVGRWAVAVDIDGRGFFADDKISYILKEEAAKESINLGKNLINRGRA